MPYQLREEAMFLRVVFFDAITPHDLVSLADELTVIEQTHPVAPNRLIDLSQIAGRHLDYTDILTFVGQRQQRQHSNRVKVALLAPSNVQRIFAQMFQRLLRHPQTEIEIFATMDEVEAWLTQL
jgi:hypothetical protein